jgi:hypothetical protein
MNFLAKEVGEEIIPGLWLGEAAGARSEEWKNKNKITHVLACLPVDQDDSACDKRLPVCDRSSELISAYFSTTNSWIHQKIKEKACVFVHCFAGVSRSATIVISYLIDKHDYTFESAVEHVQEKRSCICPNRGFTSQLRQFAAQLAMDRAMISTKRNKGENKNKRRILRLIWQYGEGDWKRISTLTSIGKHLFA